MQIIGLRAAIVSMFITVMCGGCVSTLDIRQLSKSEIESVRQSKLSIALFRYTAQKNSQTPRLPEDAWITFANVDEGQAPNPYAMHVAPVYASDPELKQEGWLYAVLPPGTYFLYVKPPTTHVYHLNIARFGTVSTTEPRARGAFWHPSGIVGFLLEGSPPSDFKEVPGFWFTVPDQGPMIYLGSLSVSCRHRSGFFAADQCSEFEISDESALAKNVAGKAFPDIPEVRTQLMGRLGGRASGSNVTHLFPMGIHTIGTDQMKETEFAGGRARPVTAMHGPMPASGIFNVISALGTLATVEAEEEEARKAREKWKPCLNRLARNLPVATFDDVLAREMKGSLGEGNDIRILQSVDIETISSTLRTRLNSILETHLLNVGLRECVERGQFCMEVALRARVRDLHKETYIYDAILTYTNTYPSRFEPISYSQRMYYVPTPELSSCRPLDTYCAEGGLSLLENEISKGIRFIAAKLKRELMAEY